MKILSLLFMLLSTQAFAGFDWQYSIKYPDGKIETKNISDSNGFFFQAGDYLCSVSEPDSSEEDGEPDYYDVNCLSEKRGTQSVIPQPNANNEFTVHDDTILDNKDKSIRIEVVAFNYFSKKTRKPFSR